MVRKKRTRQYAGEPEAAPLLAWLNSDKTDQAQRVRVTRTLREVAALVEQWSKPIPRAQRAGLAMKTLEKTLENLRTRFPEVRLRPAITWQPTDASPSGLMFGITYETSRTFTLADAFLAITELLDAGLIPRVRECACGRWYFRRFAHQHFCKGGCQQRAYRQTETFREKRAAYMKKRYWDEKRRAARKLKLLAERRAHSQRNVR